MNSNPIISESLSNRRQVHVWCPDLLVTKGGIQAFSLYLIRALCTELPNAQLSIVLKHDHPATKTQLLELCGLPVTVHCCGQWPRGIRTYAFALQLIWSALFGKPDLIVTTHLHFAPVARILQWFHKVPYWVVVHGVEGWSISGVLRRWAMRGASKVLVVSRYTGTRLLSQGEVSPNAVSLFPNTFEESRFRIAPKPTRLAARYGIEEHEKVLLTVARLDADEKYKGVDKVLAAIPTIRKQLPHIRYLVVGDGSDRNRLEKLADDFGVSSQVTFVGSVDDSELVNFYNLCDLFVMPSKGEGFGIVFLEALGCGKSVIAGCSDGARDALLDGEIGVLVDPDDNEALCRAILEALASEATPEASRILRERVVSHYGFEPFRARTRELVAELL